MKIVRHTQRPQPYDERLGRIEHLLEVLVNLTARLVRGEIRLMATVDQILEGLAELPTIDEGLDAVFAALQTLIQQGKQDPAKLDQALSLLTTHKDRVKADIVANTPEAPVTP
jgi:hypothetical protein